MLLINQLFFDTSCYALALCQPYGGLYTVYVLGLNAFTYADTYVSAALQNPRTGFEQAHSVPRLLVLDVARLVGSGGEATFVLDIGISADSIEIAGSLARFPRSLSSLALFLTVLAALARSCVCFARSLARSSGRATNFAIQNV